MHTRGPYLPGADLYRTLARNLPGMAVLLFDHDLRFLAAEGAALAQIGLDCAALPGRLLLEVVSPAQARHLEPLYRRALAGAEVTFELEHNGAMFSARALPVRDESDAIIAGMVVVEDVTSRFRDAETLRQHMELLIALRRVNDELTERLDVDYVLQMALDIAMRLSVARVGIIRLIENGQVTRCHMAGAYPPAFVRSGYKRIRGVLRRAVETRQAVLLPDVTTDPDYVANVRGMRAQMTLPLVSRDTLVGVLNLETDRPQHFTPDVFEFLKMLADRVAVALDNARLYDMAQRQLAEMQALYERVSRLEQLKSDMIRIAAHDIRNPVGVIVGYAQLLRESASQDQLPRVEAIASAARRIEKITHDILSLQRIEQAADRSAHTLVDLADLMRAACRDHHDQARLKGLSCTVDIPETPALVYGDAPQLHEALTNLMSNAIKYTPAGGAVSASLLVDAGRVCVRVSDTGYGVPAEMQARLFQPFFRAHTREVREVEGTGLGLHLVQNIVERHGGEVVFHSVHGQGSTFGFDLPAAEQPPAPAPRGRDARSSPAPAEV
ncbi:MAG: PAS domain-containing sensor histidine kinase [Aggregatilineales bacterium]